MSSSETTERRRLSPDDRRAELARAVRAVLSERGYDGVTVCAVVERAGVAQGTFYRYFDGLRDAIREVVVEALEPISRLVEEVAVDRIQSDTDLHVCLLQFYRALARMLAEDPRLFREVVVVIPAVGGGAGDAARAFLQTMRRYLRAVLSAVNGRPPFRVMDPQIVGGAIIGMVVGAAQEVAELGPAFAPEAWAQEMAKLETGALVQRTTCRHKEPA